MALFIQATSHNVNIREHVGTRTVTNHLTIASELRLVRRDNHDSPHSDLAMNEILIKTTKQEYVGGDTVYG